MEVDIDGRSSRFVMHLSYIFLIECLTGVAIGVLQAFFLQ